jgi:endo-1,4-beta-D-glucanase Y
MRVVARSFSRFNPAPSPRRASETITYRAAFLACLALSSISGCERGTAAPGATTSTPGPTGTAPVAPTVTPTGAQPSSPSVEPDTTAILTSGDDFSAPATSGETSSSVEDASSSGPAEPEEVRGPLSKTDKANFPFPQNRDVGPCKVPALNRNADVIAAFEKWKSATVTADGANGALRVKRLASDPKLELGSTVSEGIAYGMIIAVYMNEQEMFDQFWKYSQQWLDDNGLMHWYINAAGTEVLGSGAASDSDEDIAWALVMADRQWGGSGSLDDTYLNLAKTQIERVWQHEVLDGKLVKAGDKWGGWGDVNISYFAPSYYRTFAQVTGNDGWLDVVQTSYDTLANGLREENGNSANGLVPAWCTSEGEPNANVWQDGSAPTHYQYDSCRTPFRIGLDYCFHNEPQAEAYVAKTTRFFAGIGAANIVDGYDLDGTPRPEFGNGQSAAFVGPAAVGGMYSAEYGTFVQEAYDRVKTLDLVVGGEYYDLSWTVLSLLMMTGNFLDYTAIEPVEAQ